MKNPTPIVFLLIFYIKKKKNFLDFISNLGTEFCERSLLGLNKTSRRKMSDKPIDIPEDKRQTKIQP